jgi:UDP:flavonoid glycosyltransferase YjiC (YdhE family)
VVATAEVYRQKVLAEAVEFAAVRPDIGELLGNKDVLAKFWDIDSGTEYLIRDYILPVIGESYADLAAACNGADLLLTHAAAYAGPVVAEALKLRWLSVVLQPVMFVSAFDPPVLPGVQWARHLYGLGPGFFRLLKKAGRFRGARWMKPVTSLRERAGLPPTKANPFFEGQYSPFGTLALFSRHFAAAQPDWPAHTEPTGFVRYDRRGEGFGGKSANGLNDFLEKGPPPVLFTLGSSAVMHPGTFFAESLAAVSKLGLRAVLLVGQPERPLLPASLPDGIYVTDYVPYSEVMPRVAATVHQGGIGTTAQALSSGRPMIIVPWSHDQPDNAQRCLKLGVSRTIERSRYRGATAAKELERVLKEPSYAAKAAEIAAKLRSEDGLRAAADIIETLV